MATITFGGKSLVDPWMLRADCIRQGEDTSWFGLPNAYKCPLGREAGRGYLLMARADYEALDASALHDLKVTTSETDVVCPAGLPPAWSGELTLKNLLIVACKSVTPGLRGDAAEVLLVEIADRRHLLKGVPINTSYNVPSVPDADYYAATVSGGVTPYTWAEIAEDLWDTVGTDKLLSAWGGFPDGFTPHGTPENLRYFGMSAWDALNDLLERLGLAVAYNPFLDIFAVVQIGGENTGVDTFLEEWEPWRRRDTYAETNTRAKVPEKVRVLFRKIPPPAGESPFYVVDVAVNSDYFAASEVETGTVHHIHDDLAAVYNSGGSLTNTTDLADRADERAEDYSRQLSVGLDPLKIVFGLPCANLSCLPQETIWWTEWADRGRGWTTEICRYPDVPAAKLRWTPLINEDVNEFGGLSATITGATWDGASATTIDASMTTLRVDTRDGLGLANVSTGVDLLTIADASASQAGIVSTGAQTIGGDKTLTDDLILSLGTLYFDSAVQQGMKWEDSGNNERLNLTGYADTGASAGLHSQVIGVAPYAATLGELSWFQFGSGAIFRTVHNLYGTADYAQFQISSAGLSYVVTDDSVIFQVDTTGLTVGQAGDTCYYAINGETGKTHTSAFGDVYTGGILTTAASAYNLDNLSNVTVPTPSNLDVLQWNGSAWVNVPASGLVTTATVADGDKGDITVSSSGATWTIDNDVVTYAKMQNISATSRILGRKTAGSGDTEECTLSEVLDFVGSAAQGDILYRNGTVWTRLGAGTAGYVLQTGGAGANPSWVAAASSYTDEQARDAVAATYVEGLGIDISVNDGADTSTFTRQYLGGRAYRSTNQTISNATYTAVSFDLTSFGSSFYSAGAPTRLTVPSGKDGFYRITGHIRWDTFASRVVAYLWKNGSTVMVYEDDANASGHYQSQSLSCCDYLAAGDYIEIFVLHAAGSSKVLFGGEHEAFLELDFIGI